MNRRALLGLAATLILAGCGQAQPNERKQIVFSILPGQEQAVEDWGRIRGAFA